MAIKCGHCGDRHNTVAQVHLCGNRRAYMTAAQREHVAEELGRQFAEVDTNLCEHVFVGLPFCVRCGTQKAELSLYGVPEIDNRFELPAGHGR